LTLLSGKWFEVLSSRVPGLKHHFLHLGPPATPGIVTEQERNMLRGRSMTVRYVLMPASSCSLLIEAQSFENLPHRGHWYDTLLIAILPLAYSSNN
jgi:hypothetical protein